MYETVFLTFNYFKRMENKRFFCRGMFRLSALLLVMFVSLSAFAQKLSVKGRVVDTANEAVIGASIQEKEPRTVLLLTSTVTLHWKSSPKLPLSFLTSGIRPRK